MNDKCVFEEFFAPVFTIASYQKEIDIKQYFYDDRYYTNEMYVSVFGNLQHKEYLHDAVILQDMSVLDFEDGNFPFGGYGKKANYIAKGAKQFVHPILISEAISMYM